MHFAVRLITLFGTVLLCLLSPIQSWARTSNASASLTLVAPSSACDRGQLGSVAATRGRDGTFEFTIALKEPGTYRLECGAAYEVFLAPGDRMRMTLGAKGSIEFSGRGAPANLYLSTDAALSMAAFASLAPQQRSDFVNNWQALHARDLARLHEAQRKGADATFVEREKARLRFRWAQGRILYPFFHWRESDEVAIVPDPNVPGIVKDLRIEDPQWWSLPEQQEVLGAYIHTLARDRLQTVPALRTGDNRWLRAELDVVASQLADPKLRLREATRLITAHVDDNGSKGIEPVLAQWHAMSPDADAIKKVDELIANDLKQREGSVAEAYRRVDGVPLEIHVLEPTVATKQEPRPAMLWLHGGSFTNGTWWHSPGITTALRQDGIVVFAVEMRTSDRFDSGPVEQISDASAAYDWVKQHASDYRIDTKRIGVAGFSSGATLALILATRGFDPNIDNPPNVHSRARPAAVIIMDACANPLSKKSDGWFRKEVGKVGNPSDYSPTALIAPGMPKLLAIHATEDEFCEYSDTKEFVDHYAGAGNDAVLSTVEGVTHFFGFYYKPGQAQAREAIATALHRWGWSD
jgi:acetyl esterase/lipase